MHDDRVAKGISGRFAQFMSSYWSRGEPGRPGMPQRTVAMLYSLWVAAFVLKLLGSSADIAWHFKILFDSFSLPHDINLAGLALGIAGVVFHTYTGYGMDRFSLRLCQWGVAVFAIAAPLDALNHAINGLDITTWAPAHFLLYAGTAIWATGVCRGALHALAPGRLRGLVTSAFAFFFFENAMFPNGQQEYGIIEIQTWLAGAPEGSPTLLSFLAQQFHHPVDAYTVEHFALPIPDWFYPGYGILAGALTLVVANRVLGTRWAATRIAFCYVAYRTVMWQIMAWLGLTKSAVPFWLVALGLGVDLALLISHTWWRIVIGSMVITVVGYAALAAQATWQAPPIGYHSAPYTFVALAVSWSAGQRWGTPAWRKLAARVGRFRPVAQPEPSPTTS
jgi:hypothetical protein